MLRTYYSRFMPFERLFAWLGYADTSTTEWAMELENDIMVRHLSFNNANEMKQKVLEKLPKSIHLGPRYNYSPAKHHLLGRDQFKVVESHLRFDIDVTDYNDVRFCCDPTKKTICVRCWPLMVGAMRIVDYSLRTSFGFESKSILWVFSGGRGVHCWVGGSRARKLTWEGRRAVAEYIGNPLSRLAIWFVPEWYERTEPVFQEYANRQRLYMGSSGYGDLLEFMTPPNRRLLPSVESVDIKDNDSAWPFFKDVYEKQAFRYGNVLHFIVLKYMRPRLDIDVTKSETHLLKIPFSIHPRTERVCCPIDIASALDFDPSAVPTLEKLLDGVQEGDIGSSVLKEYTSIFNKSIDRPIEEEEEQKDRLQW